MDMIGISDAIASTALSDTLKTYAWIIPSVQSIHILAIAAIMASIAMLNLRLAGVIGRGQSALEMTRRFLPWVWMALPVSALTGLILTIAEPERELGNSLFWYKMLLLLVAVLLTIPVQKLIEDKAVADHPAGSRLALRVLAVVSLGLWVGIVFCGRWIAYT